MTKRRGRPPGKSVGRRTNAGNYNLYTTNGDEFDSPLTFRGTPRKNKYTTKKKAEQVDYLDNQYISPRDLRNIQESAMIKLLSFAPQHTIIYTQSYFGLRYSILLDFFVVVNNRLYKLTKLVARVLKKRLKEHHYVKSVIQHCYKRRIVERKLVEPDAKLPEYYLTLESEYVKMLSNKMFGVDDGYIHQSMSSIFALDSTYNNPSKPKHKIPLVERNDLKLSVQKELGIVNEEGEKIVSPKKTYRLR